MAASLPDARAWRRESPTKLARLDITIAELRVEKERLETEAKLRARVSADEAEGALAQARCLENALLVLGAGDGPPPETGRACAHPGCGRDGAYGYGIGQPGARWACGAHRVIVEDLWRGEQDERARKAAEALAPKSDMDGVGGRLI